MMKTYYSYLALTGLDEGFKNYISKAEGFAEAATVAAPLATLDGTEKFSSRLVYSIIKGLKEEAACECKKMLLLKAPLEVVEEEIIPALNSVGESYEAKKLYLPSLLMSAEAANSAFEIIKCELVKSNTGTPLGETVIMATVEGDIHDIGKNIVKLILQNYGFNVVDLGKDISSFDILEAAIRYKAKIVGLSALMTTTVPAMQRTIELLREKAPSCKIMVGGAVLTPEYAKTIGADAYAKDAMEAVRVAKSLLKV
jgi:5-methyltetrahydrofolate--homocysteine methyltransferase